MYTKERKLLNTPPVTVSIVIIAKFIPCTALELGSPKQVEQADTVSRVNKIKRGTAKMNEIIIKSK